MSFKKNPTDLIVRKIAADLFGPQCGIALWKHNESYTLPAMLIWIRGKWDALYPIQSL